MWTDIDRGVVEQYAILLDRWYKSENPEGADRLNAELRLRGDALGLNPAARVRLGWKTDARSRSAARHLASVTPIAALPDDGKPRASDARWRAAHPTHPATIEWDNS